jgi:hypothetical protein
MIYRPCRSKYKPLLVAPSSIQIQRSIHLRPSAVHRTIFSVQCAASFRTVTTCLIRQTEAYSCSSHQDERSSLPRLNHHNASHTNASCLTQRPLRRNKRATTLQPPSSIVETQSISRDFPATWIATRFRSLRGVTGHAAPCPAHPNYQPTTGRLAARSQVFQKFQRRARLHCLARVLGLDVMPIASRKRACRVGTFARSRYNRAGPARLGPVGV